MVASTFYLSLGRDAPVVSALIICPCCATPSGSNKDKQSLGGVRRSALLQCPSVPSQLPVAGHLLFTTCTICTLCKLARTRSVRREMQRLIVFVFQLLLPPLPHCRWRRRAADPINQDPKRRHLAAAIEGEEHSKASMAVILPVRLWTTSPRLR